MKSYKRYSLIYNPTILTIFDNARITAADKDALMTTLTKDASPLVANLLKLTQQIGDREHYQPSSARLTKRTMRKPGLLRRL